MVKNLAKERQGLHKALEFLCEKYNSPIIGLKLGRELVIYAIGQEIVKDIHSREEFDGRPDTFFMRLRTMGDRLGITVTGDDGNNQLKMLEHAYNFQLIKLLRWKILD